MATRIRGSLQRGGPDAQASLMAPVLPARRAVPVSIVQVQRPGSGPTRRGSLPGSDLTVTADVGEASLRGDCYLYVLTFLSAIGYTAATLAAAAAAAARFRRLALALTPACCGATRSGLLFGYDTGVISGAMLLLVAEFHFSVHEQALIVSITLVGCIVAALLASCLTETVGRRPTILLCRCNFRHFSHLLFAWNSFSLGNGRAVPSLPRVRR